MKDAYVKRGWIIGHIGGVVLAAGLGRVPQAWAQADEAPVEEKQVSYAEAVAETLAKAFELVDRLEGSREQDEAWKADYSEAAKRSNAVLESDPLNVKARYVQGRLATLQGKPRDALPLIEAYADDPAGAADWKAHKLLGDLYLVSYAEQARARYKIASKLAPDEPEPLIGLANALIRMERADEAVDNARLGIRNDKKQTASYRQVLAEALLLLPNQQNEATEAAREAVQITERAIRDNPGNLAFYSELQAEYKLLLRCCDARFAIQKNNPDIVVDVARTMQDQADLERLISYHKALRLVEEARKRADLRSSSTLMFEEARLARLLGRNDRAVEVLKELLEVQPDHDGARELLNVIEGAPGDAPAANLSSAQP